MAVAAAMELCDHGRASTMRSDPRMPLSDDEFHAEPMTFQLRAPPRDVVWGVIASLILLALAGGYLGFQNVRSGDIMPSGWVGGGGPTANVSGAAPAVALPKDDKWSTLSGAQLQDAPPAAKAKKPKDDDDSADAAAPMTAQGVDATGPDAGPAGTAADGPPEAPPPTRPEPQPGQQPPL
jgi:hypothetical protein